MCLARGCGDIKKHQISLRAMPLPLLVLRSSIPKYISMIRDLDDPTVPNVDELVRKVGSRRRTCVICHLSLTGCLMNCLTGWLATD